MNVDGLSAELASRKSRLWSVVTPDALAGWVFGDVEAYEPLEDFEGAAAAAERLRPVLSDPQAEEAARLYAMAIAGAMIRAAVPVAALTAGQHWMLTAWNDGDWWRSRLTVGASEVLIVAWSSNDLHCTLRVASTPVEKAINDGALDRAEMKRRGVQQTADGLRSFADDAARFHCNDIEAAFWFLSQPAVWTAARLMNSRLATGSFPFARHYDVRVAVEAWAAAEVVILGEDEAEVDAAFDRQYGAMSSPAARTERGFDADSYLAGLIEHDALCARLLEYLAVRDVAAGAGLAGVPVDLAWRNSHGRRFIAEVKSCADGNHTTQLRLGLGQILEYRHRLVVQDISPVAVLFVSNVVDPEWYSICNKAGVRLLAGDDEDAWADLVAHVHG